MQKYLISIHCMHKVLKNKGTKVCRLKNGNGVEWPRFDHSPLNSLG